MPAQPKKKGKGKFRIGKYNGWVVIGAVGGAILLGLWYRSRHGSSAATQQATDPTGSTGAGAGGGDTSGGSGSAGGATTPSNQDLLDALNNLTSILGANGGILNGAAGFDPYAYTDTTGAYGSPTWYTPGQQVGGAGGLSALAGYYLDPNSPGALVGNGHLAPKPGVTHVPVHTQKIPAAHQKPAPKRGGGGGGIRFPSTANLGTAPTFHKKTLQLPKQTAGGSATHPGRQL